MPSFNLLLISKFSSRLSRSLCSLIAAFESFYKKTQKPWVYFHKTWLQKSRKQLLDVFLLYYADLRDNMPRAAANLAYFLGVEMDESRAKCIRDYSQGFFHRQGKTANIKRLKESNSTASTVETVRKVVASCVQYKRCATSGSIWHLWGIDWLIRIKCKSLSVLRLPTIYYFDQKKVQVSYFQWYFKWLLEVSLQTKRIFCDYRKIICTRYSSFVALSSGGNIIWYICFSFIAYRHFIALLAKD